MIKKTDSPPTRSVEAAIDVPGTPEEVWRAIATGPGFTAWFMPTRLEEREGGAVAFEMFPGLETSGVVKVWDPPSRIVTQDPEWMPGAPAIATEIHVGARGGGMCRVRLVTSLFTSSADWDDQLEGVEKGWPTFLDVLRLYLTHFAGQACARAMVMGHGGTAPVGAAWDSFTAALGLSGASPGQRVDVRTKDVPAIAGVVERVGERHAIVRMDPPSSGFAWLAVEDCGAGPQPMVLFYLYGDRGPDAVARIEPEWRTWMERRFPAPAPATTA